MASKYVKNDLYYTKNLMVKITEKQKMMMNGKSNYKNKM